MSSLAVTVATLILAHELPPGEVERAIQVTIQPDTIEILYQFGLSDQTMREQLDEAGQSPAADLSALESQYLAYMAPQVAEQLAVELSGTPPTDVRTSTDLILLHHLQFQCRLEISWRTPAEDVEFRLTDRNFSQLPGHYRLAVRGRRGVEVRTSEAPLIVRAVRLPVTSERPGKWQVPVVVAVIQGTGTSAPEVEASVTSPSATAPSEPVESADPAQAAPDRSAPGRTSLPAPPAPPPGPPPATPRAIPASLMLVILLVIAAFTVPFLLAKSR